MAACRGHACSGIAWAMGCGKMKSMEEISERNWKTGRDKTDVGENDNIGPMVDAHVAA